jgi:hypothetical protein
MRSLGEFVGHIARGVKAPVAPKSHTTHKEIHEETRDTPQGKITLRRTTIEEIELPPGHPPKPPPNGP